MPVVHRLWALRGAWVCPDNAAIQALGCDTLAPDNLLAGFTPLRPIMRCHSFKTELPDSEHFRCVEGSYNGYLLFQDGHYRLIANQSELQAWFAPVESADEALSFALVATNLAAKFGLKGPAINTMPRPSKELMSSRRRRDMWSTVYRANSSLRLCDTRHVCGGCTRNARRTC